MVPMLPGRESLIRLIGKRRRTLPPNLWLLLESVASDSSSGKNKASLEACSAAAHSEKPGDLPFDVEWVACPVCGCSIRGTDCIINSHLDSCLATGKKRKLTQSTLLQFNFRPKSTTTTPLTNSSYQANFEKANESNCANESNTSDAASIENIVNERTIPHHGVDLPSLNMHCQSLKIPRLGSNEAEDSDFVETLETFIVGRRFQQNIELRHDASLSVLRDSENSNDIHAIKVYYADAESEQMLGYLPRELARCLSPLIDKNQIKCQGSITSLPKHPLGAVPIRLVCQMVIKDNSMESVDRETFKLLWRDVVRVVDHAKTPSYQRNFRLLVQDVLHNHLHLFVDEETSFLGLFNLLSDDAQRLFVRLYTRKGPWFRMANISYPEISDLKKAILELQLAGYIDSFPLSEAPSINDIRDVLDVLSASEIREISKLELCKKGVNSARRKDICNHLYHAYINGRCPYLPKRVLEWAGTCVKISSMAEMLLWRVQRLFFLNGDQDLSAFLLVNLGLVRFPDYTCSVSLPIFPDRNNLLAYDEALGIAQIMDQSLDEYNLETIVRCINLCNSHIPKSFEKEIQLSVPDSPLKFFSHFSAAWVYSKVLFLGVSVFEHERRYEDAVGLLRVLLSRFTSDSRRGHWLLRLSVDLEHLGRLDESLSVAEEGVLDPWVRAGSKMALQRRIVRLAKPPRRWRVPNCAHLLKRKIKEVNINGRPLNCETGAKNIFYGYDGDLCGVEQLALQYYAGDGGSWQGIHSESGIWMTIFGLLMWDIIFSDVPNVFHSKFQMAPLDLDTDDFYVARKFHIEAHLKLIQDGKAEEILTSSWKSHCGTSCRGVNWERHSLSELQTVVACIGGHCLASLCRHLAQDYRSWSSGMPDLLLWRFHGDRDVGESKLVEVKGPRDRLSEQQRAWMLLLMDCGFDTEVCKVSPVPLS
ncbi:Phosphodiesterase I protein [Dioscorea alata]|uniref:Phosphodiesterase I protein n=1 Tax=Dioscorea alata TaxID=55571 RepID=A0ACB7U6C6_DIOAL|nr:Phosphodiesterase I protein [Dioscorea alata]